MQLLLYFMLIGAGFVNAAPKLSCSARELRGQDCRLNSGIYSLRLLERTIVWNDGTWHTVDPMPLIGEGVEWESIRFDILNKHPILQLWLWDKGVGEAQVQSLHWYVTVPEKGDEKRQLKILAEGVVRKRHLKEIPPPPAPAPSAKPVKVEAKAPPTRRFLYDALEPHSLKAAKNGQLEWTLGRQKQNLNLEGVPNGI